MEKLLCGQENDEDECEERITRNDLIENGRQKETCSGYLGLDLKEFIGLFCVSSIETYTNYIFICFQ